MCTMRFTERPQRCAKDQIERRPSNARRVQQQKNTGRGHPPLSCCSSCSLRLAAATPVFSTVQATHARDTICDNYSRILAGSHLGFSLSRIP